MNMHAATDDSNAPNSLHSSRLHERNMQHATAISAPLQDTPHSTSEPFSRLLGLPPEIRTMIWNYTLTSPAAVQVTGQLKQPPLVQVNRQIRSETRKLALLLNRFEIDIVACDARLFAKFFQLWHRVVNNKNTDNNNNKQAKTNIKNKKKISLPIRIALVGDCHWLNLVWWCKLVKRGKCGSLTTGPAGLGRSKIVEAATTLAVQADSWEEVERGLEIWRPLAGLDDAQWLVDL